ASPLLSGRSKMITTRVLHFRVEGKSPVPTDLVIPYFSIGTFEFQKRYVREPILKIRCIAHHISESNGREKSKPTIRSEVFRSIVTEVSFYKICVFIGIS